MLTRVPSTPAVKLTTPPVARRTTPANSLRVFIVYVRPSRYTYQFMEENEYFTVSFYDDEYKKALGYLGTKSGRDTDKVKDVNFTPFACGESVSFKEANLTILCKKIYIQDLEQAGFPEKVNERYYPTNDVHRYYIGEIVDIIE